MLDPCVGARVALHLLTSGANVERNSYDHGNAFDTVGKAGSFSFLYLNPPYDFEMGSMNNKRMEYLFLDHTYHLLVEGGVLLMVVPAEKLESLRTLAGQIRQHFYKITLPWSDEGYRLLPAHIYFELTTNMREFEQSSPRRWSNSSPNIPATSKWCARS